MKTSSNENGTKLIFVYLPTWERFNSKFSFIKFSHKRKIENIVKNLNINYIDIAKIFNMSENPIELYPFGLSGHFTPEGYELIAREIYKYAKKIFRISNTRKSNNSFIFKFINILSFIF